jgi:radical SAM superfamily enzyme YgiQ (UPF0313 family)
MKVLIISANTFRFSPSGPAYIAGAARDAGYTVEVFDCLFADDMIRELEEHITRFKPDVIGISIRTVTGLIPDETAEFHMKPFDTRVLVKEMVDCIKRLSSAPIVPGGPGFNYYGPDWLDYLNLDYGLRGEAEFSFPEYLKRLENGADIHTIPGCVYRQDHQFIKIPREKIENLDTTSLPAYDLFNLDGYVERNIGAGISTRRGCAFRCTYCAYSSLEGTRYRMKSPERVVDEMEYILKTNNSLIIEFCDNCFNFPLKQTIATCQEIIRRGSDIRWRTIDLKPIDVTDDFLRLCKKSGCDSLFLDTASASNKMLQSMHRGYSAAQVRESLSCLSRSDIPFGVYLLLGAPGETPETIAETLSVIDSFPISRLSVTIGINLWTHHQPIVEYLRRNEQFPEDENLFDEIHYISPELPKDYMIDLIHNLNERENCDVFLFKPYAGYKG